MHVKSNIFLGRLNDQEISEVLRVEANIVLDTNVTSL
jgi:hypothetical protein